MARKLSGQQAVSFKYLRRAGQLDIAKLSSFGLAMLTTNFFCDTSKLALVP